MIYYYDGYSQKKHYYNGIIFPRKEEYSSEAYQIDVLNERVFRVIIDIDDRLLPQNSEFLTDVNLLNEFKKMKLICQLFGYKFN